jgi:hypothetical protein
MKKFAQAAAATIAVITSVVPIASTALAQAAVDTKPCDTPLHHQFDFWIGAWNVTQGGKNAGKNEIESVLGGCALLESWTGTGGVTGHSLNVYDSTRGVWHQTWVDSSGSLLTLEGKLEKGEMILQGSALAEKGARPALQRITWTPQPAGSVRQLWQSSADGGQSWKTEFDGLYERTE